MMNFTDYVSEISFRFMQPQNNFPKGWGRVDALLRRFNSSMEFVNTKLPENGSKTKSIFRELCQIPRMSTLAIGATINKAVAQMSDSDVFVNVGVWNGFTFLAGIVNNSQKKCIGVDNFSQFNNPKEAFLERFNRYKSPNHYFYEMDYIEYFNKHHKDPIGLYLYDGEHSYENQLKGLQVAEPFFSQNCLILIDDTNWDEPRKATMDFVSRSSYKYKVILDQNTSLCGHPTLWNGIILLQKIN